MNGSGALIVLPGGATKLAELRKEVAALADAVEQRSIFLDELDVARRIWRAHRDLVETEEYCWALVRERLQLQEQLAQKGEELEALDPLPF
jgi:hypothetical protein